MNNSFQYLFKFININNEFYFHRIKFKSFLKYKYLIIIVNYYTKV